jgi:putative FmdB family regulatory protein
MNCPPWIDYNFIPLNWAIPDLDSTEFRWFAHFQEKPMPYYDYVCLDCKRRFSLFMSYSEYGTRPVHCTHCSSENVRRRIGRIRIARSEESRLEDLADPSGLEGLEDDPQALGRMMRKMSGEMGEDLGPEFDEVIDRLEAGQSPDEIEDAIPDIGGEDGGFGGGMDDF